MICIVNAWNNFIDNVKLRRFTVLVLIIALLYAIKSLINVILLTFIFTFIMVNWRKLVDKHLPQLSSKLLIVLTYATIVGLVYWAATAYLPVLIDQLMKLSKSVSNFYSTRQGRALYHDINQYVNLKDLTHSFGVGAGAAVNAVSMITDGAISFSLSLVLSFFISFDFEEVKSFANRFLTSDSFDWLFGDIAFFGTKFINTFGVVLEAQFFIALCNTALTTAGLYLLGLPSVLALSLVVFVCSLVPVAGVFVSLVPLSFVAYSTGGVNTIINVIILIICVHLCESYILNPHLMSKGTKIPVPMTFAVLIVAEHFWSIWGLIIGVPVFAFALDVLDVKKIKDPAEDLKKLNNEK